MSIGPNIDPIYRAIYKEQEEKKRDKKEKKQVNYQGRRWTEVDDPELSLDEKLAQSDTKEKPDKKKSKVLYIEADLLNEAKKLLAEFTLEEKIAQLCFYKTEAAYDLIKQKELEAQLLKWQLGGILFLRGSYKRQADLIAHYQTFLKIPLLIGNDFLHGLSFYFDEDISKMPLTLQHVCDLGKAVMGQNRSLGVHFLFDRENVDIFPHIPLSEEQKHSFRKGIRLANGVVARDLEPSKWIHKVSVSLPAFLSGKQNAGNKQKKDAIDSTEQFIGMRTFFLRECNSTEEVVKAFLEGYEAFVIETSIQEIIEACMKAVIEKVLSEDELDKHVLKVLMLKCYFKCG